MDKYNTGRACMEYAQTVDDCEVTEYIELLEDARKWMRNIVIDSYEVHHIHKRPLPIERNHWCNLIRISKAAHMWIHDVNPYAGELCCWYAKFKKEQRQREWDDISGTRMTDIEQSHFRWHVPTLDIIVRPYESFRSRVIYLRAMAESPYNRYADEILGAL